MVYIYFYYINKNIYKLSINIKIINSLKLNSKIVKLLNILELLSISFLSIYKTSKYIYIKIHIYRTIKTCSSLSFS